MNSLKNLTYTVLIFATQDASNRQRQEITLFSLNLFWLGQCLLYVQPDSHWRNTASATPLGTHRSQVHLHLQATNNYRKSKSLVGRLAFTATPRMCGTSTPQMKSWSAQSLRPGRFRRPQFKCHVQSIQKPDVHQKLQVLCVKLRSPLTCCLIHPAQLSWETPNPWRMSQLGCYLTRKSDGFRNHVRVRISIQYIYIYISYIIRMSNHTDG